jgi:perosamine synthetase
MARAEDNLFCGPCTLRLRDVIGGARAPEVRAWFGHGTVFWVHQARVGIHWLCHFLGLGRGDEVLVPAYNCGTEVDALLASGVSLAFYEVDARARIDVAQIGAKLTPRVKAVYVIHYFGFPQPLEELRRLCDQKGLYLVEDCALALFSRDGTVLLGSLGDVSVFSFPKSLPVPDGGAVVINRRPQAAGEASPQKRPPLWPVLQRLLPFAKRNLLQAVSGHERLYPFFSGLLQRARGTLNAGQSAGGQRPDIPASYYYDQRRSDRRMSHISEFILQRIDVAEAIERRRRNFQHYLQAVPALRGLTPLFDGLPAGVCPLSFPVLVPHRDRLCGFLQTAGIDATAWWSGYHRSLPWSEHPQACFLKDNLMTLPVHQGLREAQVARVIAQCAEALEAVRDA